MRRQVCRGRTNEERGKKSKDGRAERNVIGLTTSGCCSQQLYICVGSSVSCAVLKVTAGPGVHHTPGSFGRSQSYSLNMYI